MDKPLYAIAQDRPVDLTGAIRDGMWHHEPSAAKQFWKRFGLFGVLAASNVATLAIGYLVWGFFQASVTVNYSLMQSSFEQQDKIREMDSTISRLVEFQDKSPADVVRIGKVIARILATASGEERRFLETALPQAMRLQIKENIPASAVVAMAIHESGYGKSQLAKQHHNYFGMKAFSDWKGDVAESMPTRDSGVLTRANFRAYSDLYEGFLGFSQFLKRSDRYDQAFRQPSGEGFVRCLLDAGYCPDSSYLPSIRNIMNRHGLKELEAILDAGKDEMPVVENAKTLFEG